MMRSFWLLASTVDIDSLIQCLPPDLARQDDFLLRLMSSRATGAVRMSVNTNCTAVLLLRYTSDAVEIERLSALPVPNTIDYATMPRATTHHYTRD
jgi:hypothetical protein